MLQQNVTNRSKSKFSYIKENYNCLVKNLQIWQKYSQEIPVPTLPCPTLVFLLCLLAAFTYYAIAVVVVVVVANISIGYKL